MHSRVSIKAVAPTAAILAITGVLKDPLPFDIEGVNEIAARIRNIRAYSHIKTQTLCAMSFNSPAFQVPTNDVLFERAQYTTKLSIPKVC